ncbi:MAG: BON domain-containing protein [Bdellovibrionales bacterium]
MKTNADLQKDVYAELKWDPRIHEGDIGVSVSDGLVTLSGYIPSYAEKWAAEEAAKKVAGVRAVINEISVKLIGVHRKDDHELAQAALNTIKWNVWTGGDDVKITVQNGWITMSGELESNFQKQTAEDAVRHLAGVRGVSNEIKIRPSAKPKDIQSEIKRALHRHADQEANRIEVNVAGGIVDISGTVNSWTERADVEWAAFATNGVQKVNNHLKVSNV